MLRAVVVSHRSRATLGRCLASLGATPVTVVDNASDDGSAELVERDFPAARLLRSERNLGFGAACNLATREGGADAWFFLNPDAWLVQGTPGDLARRLEQDPGLGAVAPRLVHPDGRPQFVWSTDRGLAGEALQLVRNRFEDRAWNHGAFPRLWRRLVGPGWFSAAALCVRARAFEEIGGFDEGYFLYFEDADLCLRLRRAGHRLDLVPSVVVAHERGGSGAPSHHYRASQRRYYELHRPRWERWVLERWLARREEEGADGTRP